MRGSLNWANTIAGWWSSTAVSVVKRQQRAMWAAMVKPRGRKPVARGKR